MSDEKKDVPAVATPDTSSANDTDIYTQIIASTNNQSQVQNNNITPINQGKSKSKKFAKTKVINGNQKVYSAAFKFYDEQITSGDPIQLAKAVKALPKSGIGGVQALLICHYKCIITDGIWACAYLKRHYHLIFRCADPKQRMRVFSFLKSVGVEYRQGIDDDLWVNHGVETIGNFSGYALYLTHETEDAIRDGKEKYDVTEIISNLTPDEVEQVRAGYVRMSENRKLTQQELISLDTEAFDLGYQLKSFDSWYNSLSFAVRSHTKMRVIRESYNRGIDARITDDKTNNNQILRCCIFIQGEANSGKTYASVQALAGKPYLRVGGGGSGKFDFLRPEHQAIIVDDDVCPNLLNMCDNYICRAYRRNKDNPVWAGQFFVVTSNLSFAGWIASCGIKTHDYINGQMQELPHFKALKTRFFVCRVAISGGVRHLALISPSTRGTADEQCKRADMFMEFKKAFDNTISTYTPQDNTVDFSRIIERS